MTRDRTDGKAAALQFDEMSLYVLDAQVGRLHVVGLDARPELRQIALIGGNGRAGQAALNEQIIEKPLDQRRRWQYRRGEDYESETCVAHSEH